jgi:hypothetical protein
VAELRVLVEEEAERLREMALAQGGQPHGVSHFGLALDIQGTSS